MTDIVDLRSDTLTKPTPGMRESMFNADVGDDVFGEDPTINALQEKAAALLGMEAALFVPSGTMANQLAIYSQTEPAREVIVEAECHIFMYEAAAAASVSSVQLRMVPGNRGLMDPADVEAAIRPQLDPHQPPTQLICVENTSNRGGGSVYPLETIRAIGKIAREHDIPLHMDGARLFNACAASGVPVTEYARECSTVSFCLSKGLGAPVGSLLVGNANAVYHAWRGRKMLGGGMRQAGILAAAGLYALENHLDRLVEDHENARALADGLAGIDGLDIDPTEVESNIVIFRVTRPGLTPDDLCTRLNERGIRMLPFGKDKVRAVTHLDVDRAGIDRALNVLEDVMAP